MSKNKRRKSEKKRNLKYGNITVEKVKNLSASDIKDRAVKGSEKNLKTKSDNGFRKELRKNLTFVGIFLVSLVVLYFVLTYTSILDPILNYFGLSGVYKK
ncbi:MAG: hypothetical protein Q7S53_01585 [bacterium]|nr:hypothetical protein [bacterium]